jgi:DNA-binding NarL/FixJ family response regulator
VQRVPRISYMASVASRDCSDGQLHQATLTIVSIASSESIARRALAALRQIGLIIDGRHLGSGPAAGERLCTDTDVVLIMEDGPKRAALVVQAARRRAPEVGIVVVVPAATRGETRGLIAAGADALVLEGEGREVLAAAVRSVSLGQISVPRPFRECLDRPALSARERQIIVLVAAGCTNAQIAERLCLAESTIKAHISSVIRRLGVRSRRQAAAAVLARDDEFRPSILSSIRPIDPQNARAASPRSAPPD